MGSSKAKTVAIIPNGYGLLNYTESLVSGFSSFSIDAKPIELPGQGNCSGRLSVQSAAKKIKADVEQLANTSNGSVTLLTHCSSMLPILELAKDADPSWWSNVDKVILYSYLAKPDLHLDRFRKKAESYGVCFNDDFSYLGDYTAKDFAKIPVSTHVIHPKTTMNRLRANQDDLEELKIEGAVATIETPSVGYEISNEYQTEKIQRVIGEDLLRHLS